MADATRAILPGDATAYVTVQVEGHDVLQPLKQREFSTGSAGFSGQLKVDGDDGRRYQVSINVVLINSKP